MTAFRPLILSGLLLLAAIPQGQAEDATLGTLHYLGAATIPNDATVDGTPVGGLSGLDYDPAAQGWVIISDDKSDKAPARFYTAKIAVGENGPQVALEHAVTLLQADGTPYPNAKTVAGKPGGEVPDPESIRFDPDGKGLWWTSEGDRKLGLTPFIREAAPGGAAMGAVPTPPVFTMEKDQERGPRHNLSFEGLSFTPDGKSLWLGMESALYQDGPIATTTAGTVARFTRFDRAGTMLAQYAYPVDPIQAVPSGKNADNGVSEILALGDDRLLVLERSGVEGADGKWRMYIRIYEATVGTATDVKEVPALAGASYTPMTKRLVRDLSKLPEIGSPTLPFIDNLEGMSFGPDLPNGHRSLVLVSDNNFNPDQITQFLAFEIVP
jgi:hypothetical protein